MQSSSLITGRRAKTALVLGLSACLAGACASKPTAGRNAAAPTYKVTKRAAALSAAAGDPSASAQAPRQAAQSRPRTTPSQRRAERPTVRAADPARARAPAVPSAAAAAPALAEASAPLALSPAQPAPVNLQSLTLQSPGASASSVAPGAVRAARAVQDAAASVPAGLRLALYILAGLALAGALLTGLMALVSAFRRRRAARAAWAEGLAAPVAANDPDAPVRGSSKRGRPAPPPPTVTILAGTRANG